MALVELDIDIGLIVTFDIKIIIDIGPVRIIEKKVIRDLTFIGLGGSPIQIQIQRLFSTTGYERTEAPGGTSS